MPTAWPEIEVDPAASAALQAHIAEMADAHPIAPYDPGRVYKKGEIAEYGDASYEAQGTIQGRPVVGAVTPVSGPVSTTINAQVTAVGKTIKTLYRHGGRIWAGYGDLNDNTGPIAVASVADADPLGAWATETVADTEELQLFRRLADGRIVAPHNDPRAMRGGYIERSAGGAWTDLPARITGATNPAAHIYDMVEHAGRLWAAGARYPAGDTTKAQATVWSSADGGATWTESLVVAYPGADPEISFAMFLAPFGNALYTMSQLGPRADFKKWMAATGWQDTDPVLPLVRSDTGAPGEPWRGGWLIPTTLPGSGVSTLRFIEGDGMSLSLGVSCVAFDICEQDNAIYALTPDDEIVRVPGTGPLTPKVVAKVQRADGAAPTAIAALDPATIILGTDKARLQRVTLPANPGWFRVVEQGITRDVVYRMGTGGVALGSIATDPNAGFYGTGVKLHGGTLYGYGELSVSVSGRYNDKLFSLPVAWLRDVDNGVVFCNVSFRAGATAPYIRGLARLRLWVGYGYDGVWIDGMALSEGVEAQLDALPAGSRMTLRIDELVLPVSAGADGAGVAGAAGPKGDPGPPGPPGIDKNYVYTQGAPQAVWNITHGLGKMPSVTVMDSSQTVVEGEVHHVDTNSLSVTFNAAFSGKAVLN